MNDPRIIRACLFCGEDERLAVNDAGFERPVVFDYVTITMPDGHEMTEIVDGVHCLVCEAMAPLDTSNGNRPEIDYAALRNFDEQVAS